MNERVGFGPGDRTPVVTEGHTQIDGNDWDLFIMEVHDPVDRVRTDLSAIGGLRTPGDRVVGAPGHLVQLAQASLTSIRRGRPCSDLGTRTVRTPSCRLASI